ncbi:hypothetical protein C8J56DRAFT_945173 [Mycena floridula]|nr:hypothetical protein C8J56DRAFT_945173 [Mycena floridula]
MSGLIHRFSEWAIIIAFAVLKKPVIHAVWEGKVPSCDPFFYIPFLTITKSPFLVCILIHR